MLKLKRGFSNIMFDVESVRNNSIARDIAKSVIAKSVLRDGRYQSYLALGEPSWLHDSLFRKATRNN
ncbi:unnamed protein product [Brassica oleracea]